MNAYSEPNDVIFEPFAGSGTTLIAGERAHRRVRAIELAPAYVDVAILRWRLLHPASPVTLEDGHSFEDIAAARGIGIDNVA